ncbi:MAG: translation initiation factor [Candidatus Bathyarchaeia archaeon]
MGEICPTCGLPLDMCICKEISKQQQKIIVRLETRKFNRDTTIIEGLDTKNFDLQKIAKQLKTICACGGTAKDNYIMLQGDQRQKVATYLETLGFPKSNISTI